MVPKPKNPLFILIRLTNRMPFRCPTSPCWKHTLFSSSPAKTEYNNLGETNCQTPSNTDRMRNFLHTDISVSVINETRSSPPDGDANFDGNMVIILAALLCALICALGLNSIVRCFFRCSRGLSDEEGRIGSKGVAKDALGKIPVVVYGSGTDIPSTGTECSICLGEFKEGEKVRVLPRCGHGFHVKCIDAWLAKHSSCPNCRQLLYGLPAGVQSGRSS